MTKRLRDMAPVISERSTLGFNLESSLQFEVTSTVGAARRTSVDCAKVGKRSPYGWVKGDRAT